jgi:hypothetical protein
MPKEINRHSLAGGFDHLLGAFGKIKKLSSNAEIDRVCDSGIATLWSMTEQMELQKDLEIVQARRLDPTN